MTASWRQLRTCVTAERIVLLPASGRVLEPRPRSRPAAFFPNATVIIPSPRTVGGQVFTPGCKSEAPRKPSHHR